MGYGFGNKARHRLSLVKLMHKLRWSDEVPEQFEGLNFNLLIETVVDQLHEDGDAEYRKLWSEDRAAEEAEKKFWDEWDATHK